MNAWKENKEPTTKIHCTEKNKDLQVKQNGEFPAQGATPPSQEDKHTEKREANLHKKHKRQRSSLFLSLRKQRRNEGDATRGVARVDGSTPRVIRVYQRPGVTQPADIPLIRRNDTPLACLSPSLVLFSAEAAPLR
ncbi:hypothetical protein X777_14382 [Ooceraea biroi]|uniref:Uncharacterized protein n=1 Tax=Ooceraea biroi TaxID=2015173 RepID=A0A026WUT5_OOCBI|nr:hypothetical protein X777_14382 [Ooceraea biroi]